MVMAYLRQSRYTARTEVARSDRRTGSSKHTERLVSAERRHSRYTDLDQDPPRRRRWAAGYINRDSCPSYAYTSTQARSPDLGYPSDTEYITQPRESRSDYTEAREQHFEYSPTHTAKHSQTFRSTHRPPSLSPSLRDQHQHHDAYEPCYESDVEDLSGNHNIDHRTTPSKSHDSGTEEGSDIVVVSRKDGGSDIASIHSRRSSRSQSDRYSARSFSMRSDIQDRKMRNSDSESDDDGGYISLDDYIAGRSDCVSRPLLSGDEGEGSDAVGSVVDGDSDVGEGSDVAHGSDVASLSDDEGIHDDDDCIETSRSYRALRWCY